jgi:hypothetical protein
VYNRLGIVVRRVGEWGPRGFEIGFVARLCSVVAWRNSGLVKVTLNV